MRSNVSCRGAFCSRRAFIAFATASLVASSGCAVFSRPKRLDPDVFRPAVARTVEQAIAETTRLIGLKEDPDKKPRVCFIGVLGNGADDLAATTWEYLEKSTEIETIGRDRMRSAVKECGIKNSDLYIPKKREKFADALGESFDYLLAGYVEETEEPVDPDDEEGRTYKKTVYRLELFNLDTNQKFEYTADL